MSQFAPENSVDELDVDGRSLDAHTLTGLDRCDYCGAQAYVRATLATGELLFCAHHASEFKSKIQPIALEWHDESSKLFEPVGE
ncbi:MAG: hypothetical protein ABI435_09860 [Pseudolysinimonas sp.]